MSKGGVSSRGRATSTLSPRLRLSQTPVAHPGLSVRGSGARGGPLPAGSPPAPVETRLRAAARKAGRESGRGSRLLWRAEGVSGARVQGARRRGRCLRLLTSGPPAGAPALSARLLAASHCQQEKPNSPARPRGRISSSERAAAAEWAPPGSRGGRLLPGLLRAKRGKAEKTKAKKVWGALGSCAPRRRESSGGGSAGEEDR